MSQYPKLIFIFRGGDHSRIIKTIGTERFRRFLRVVVGVGSDVGLPLEWGFLRQRLYYEENTPSIFTVVEPTDLADAIH